MHLKPNLRKSCEREPTIGFAVRIDTILHRIFKENTTMTPGTFKSEKTDRQGHQKWAQGSKNGARSEPKGAIRSPKGNQRAPEGSQKWAKGRPKCIKKSVFGKDRENDGKRVAALGIRRTILGAFFHQKSMKKTMRKSMPKKSWISWKNDAKILCFLDWNSSKNRLCAKSA